MEMEMEMKIICKHIVKPAEPTWNGCLTLTELDHISVITHECCVYLYDRPVEEDWLTHNKIIETLKESLSRALVPFYPLAGRLSWIGGQGGRLKLECNSMGAELIEVESTMKIQDFGDFYSSSEKFHDLLPEMDYYGKPIEDLPLLVAQITRFACGGLCVGIGMSHIVLDGRSVFHFTDEWARLTRGELLKVAPFLDRRVLQAEDNVDEEESTTKEVDNDVGSINYFTQVGLGKSDIRKTPIFVHLTKDKIQQLKQVANYSIKDITNDDDNGRPYSRFESITAYVWRCVCKARELKGDDISTLAIVVDVRSRMDPPLPSSYFGNATVDVLISSSAEELISKPLSYACSKIREATSKVNNKYVIETIEFLKSQKSLINYQYFNDRGKLHSPPDGEHCDAVAISWLNLKGGGNNGVDFGWGREIYMGPPIVHADDGVFCLIPYKNDGSVVIGLCLEPKQNFQKILSLPIS